MPEDIPTDDHKHVTLIPTDRIRILNPRVRNRRTFEEMVESIARIGLKRPITVTRRTGTEPAEYDLVCGQGRLEAFIELKQDTIPAIVIDADESDCLVMSLVENCARRQHRAIDLMQEIGTLRKRGYSDRTIADKIGVSPEYVNMIAGLLERGEQRLVSAVETGLMPLNLAIEISRTDDQGAQRVLMEAYTEKKLRGKKFAAVRRLLERRQRRGPRVDETPFGREVSRTRRPLTSDALVRAYQQEANRQKLMIKKAELAQGRLLFVTEAFRALRSDENFLTLLRAESLEAMPTYLEHNARAVP
ncbi:plasmid partitioning protein RepB C-terminal domain-containing protein [Aquamicrobium defluvii]|uniref:Plasmid stablization protein ParB n=1 Tax=Aquamicrobium defluvii TaxID=69279 RepID=A0A011TXK3_9HYPH|nr:plasmid partitioning protein RepB C-terminal domain-containing protein [Aquamicrobium defluvii]EXL08882.1 plasmid stablization protein ParB [Aquamicrobium defluvii]EZQ16080.1 plasmid stablization protein ParB [Halopseudomonas bauzanensis]